MKFISPNSDEEKAIVSQKTSLLKNNPRNLHPPTGVIKYVRVELRGGRVLKTGRRNEGRHYISTTSFIHFA